MFCPLEARFEHEQIPAFIDTISPFLTVPNREGIANLLELFSGYNEPLVLETIILDRGNKQERLKLCFYTDKDITGHNIDHWLNTDHRRGGANAAYIIEVNRDTIESKQVT